MSKIEEAAAVIRQLQSALSLHVSMVVSGEFASETSTSINSDAQTRARQWLDSLELAEPEAVTVSVSMAPGAEPLSAEKLNDLDEYLRQQNKLKDEPEDFYPAISSGISKTSNQLLGELAGSVKRLVGHFKETRNAPKLFNVQDSERPAFVIAHSFEEALSKWKVAVAEENATDSKYEEVPPAGIMHVCDGDELIIDQGFADKANS